MEACSNNGFSERLKELLEYLDIYPATFAKNVGLTAPTITAYLSGKFEPTIFALDKILKRYPVRREWLYFGEGQMWENDYYKDRFLTYALGSKTPQEKINALLLVFDCNLSKLSQKLGVNRAYLSSIKNERINNFTQDKICTFAKNIKFISKEWW